MTSAAISSPSKGTVGRVGAWLSVRHSLRTEAAAALTLYGLYELARGLVGRDTAQAHAHARRLVALERSLHLFVEANVQRAVQTLPGLTSLLGVAYLTLHLAVTGGVLLWLHRCRPEGFPFVRTALLLASGLALIGFLLYPTAPPRLAGVGIADTVSGGHVDLNRGLVSSLYNPYAALPSMHIGYALIVAAGLLRHGRRVDVRAFAVRLDPLEKRLPIDRAAQTLLLVVEGSLTVAWCEDTLVSTELGEGESASTNPPAVELLLAGAEGAAFLAMVSRS